MLLLGVRRLVDQLSVLEDKRNGCQEEDKQDPIENFTDTQTEASATIEEKKLRHLLKMMVLQNFL